MGRKSKKAAKKATPAKPKAQRQVGKSVKSSKPAGSSGGFKATASKVASVGKSILSSGSPGAKARKGGFSGRSNARLLLKRAYERRAKRQIRMGLLGQARRTLRKKATVV